MHIMKTRRFAMIILILAAGVVFAMLIWNQKDRAQTRESRQRLHVQTTEATGAIVNARNQLNAFFPFHEKAGRKKAYEGAGKGKHLIVVQLESFQNFAIHASVQGEPITPVLNALSKESLYFPHIFQQIGIGNTSDAEFTMNSSIYPVGKAAMSEKYGNRAIPALGRMMQAEGYTANTFHVNDVSFWNRSEMYPALGFGKYYDRPYYRPEKFNRFGASDEELFRVGVEQMKTMHLRGQKFYSQFITVSSHAPFTIPKSSRKLKLPPGMDDKRLGDYLTSIHYADYALGTFIAKLKETGLWDQSVFVVYGDHFGLHPKYHKADEIAKVVGVPYHERISTFNVPLLIHLPGQQTGQRIEQTGGQIDMMPTIVNIMGIRPGKGAPMFGHDLCNIDHNVIGMRYYSPTGTFVNDDVLFVPGKKGFADGKATSIRTLEPVKDINRYKLEYDYIMQWMKLSDRYVKLLPERQTSRPEKKGKGIPAL
ncbi:LTA synthase family protein [Paenibacillus chibensis]|uniref:LTA synthase family protein n=1 Tax=Paenibacillus chibensis TaxID=59846 RepID=A0ABU6PW03_9BACL|nr:LTA synthase family protein [Paenibacillus chibensis]